MSTTIPRWPEGDELIAQALTWLARQHEKGGSRPFVVDQRWHALEDGFEQAYADHDPDALKLALREYARHALACFKVLPARAMAAAAPVEQS